jgi:ribosomal RNA-processing protein 9
MSSFFTLPGSAKRKRADAAGNKPKKARGTDTQSGGVRRPQRSTEEDEISSESEDGDAAPRGSDDEGEDEEFAGETAAEKRLRLAQQYLNNIREEVGTFG